ncbi:hypothetical protein E2C01_070922 [Portunus trituberculatus]|uniref:Uncharacterized protein n=1 Tax=Portunus trituberculatus TaxID=210409 RepID=A0A5B7I3I4_PORTR|nr:hypothetical protein [Portunus trituberculatus]
MHPCRDPHSFSSTECNSQTLNTNTPCYKGAVTEPRDVAGTDGGSSPQPTLTSFKDRRHLRPTEDEPLALPSPRPPSRE